MDKIIEALKFSQAPHQILLLQLFYIFARVTDLITIQLVLSCGTATFNNIAFGCS